MELGLSLGLGGEAVRWRTLGLVLRMVPWLRLGAGWGRAMGLLLVGLRYRVPGLNGRGDLLRDVRPLLPLLVDVIVGVRVGTLAWGYDGGLTQRRQLCLE